MSDDDMTFHAQINWNSPARREIELQTLCLTLQDRLELAIFKSHLYSFLSFVLGVALVIALATR